jgi:hypothetical protein
LEEAMPFILYAKMGVKFDNKCVMDDPLDQGKDIGQKQVEKGKKK